MRAFGLIIKTMAAIFIVSAAVCTILVFREELSDCLSGVKKKLRDKISIYCDIGVDDLWTK